MICNSSRKNIKSEYFNHSIDRIVLKYIFIRSWLKDYEDEINKLEEEVKNVKEISESLPNGCFREINLEPEA
jgi:hypothetical protein